MDIQEIFKIGYRLKIMEAARIVSPDAIIEPGEKLCIKSITYKNFGGMPFPKY